jgi:hypothetical protein
MPAATPESEQILVLNPIISPNVVGFGCAFVRGYLEHTLDGLQTAKEESLIELLELVSRHRVVDGLGVGLAADGRALGGTSPSVWISVSWAVES